MGGKTASGERSWLVTVLLLLNRSCARGVASLVILAVILHQDRLTTLLFVGAVINSRFGKLLKYLIDERRPETSHLTSSGMPSSHANSLFFLAASLLILLPQHWVACTTALAYATTVSFTRVFVTKVHTVPQIAAGMLVGTANAVFWWQWLGTTNTDWTVLQLH
eukprot:m.483257 g.483257  ORF g.483257 m.483257 type:complete len:164 (-) comp22849_c0_seq1:65-556(-)